MRTISKVIIKGHQRSGNNYLINLVGVNFFNKEYNGASFSDGHDHCLLNKLQKDTRYLYIHRNKTDTLKSVFTERLLYGIDVSDYNYFYDTHYMKMYEPTLKTNLVFSTIFEDKKYNAIQNHFFCCIEKSPSQFHDFHVNHYVELAKNNPSLLIVSYDALKNNFKSEMDKISIHLTGVTKQSYENIDKKVGWYHKT